MKTGEAGYGLLKFNQPATLSIIHSITPSNLRSDTPRTFGLSKNSQFLISTHPPISILNS